MYLTYYKNNKFKLSNVLFFKGDYENINFNRINRKDKPHCSTVSSNNKVKNI